MRRVVLLLYLLAACIAEAQAQPRVLLAVFAHPDDEEFAGPVLAAYARQGVEVHLAIATDGEAWSRAPKEFPPGPKLGAIRRAEAKCACQKLGIEPPEFFGLPDGKLEWNDDPIPSQQITMIMTPRVGENVKSLVTSIESYIAKVHPQVIVTWGPEGGYGHPDHRAVSDAVTQVIQSKITDIKLYYVGFTPPQAQQLAFYEPFHPTDPRYLPVSVPFTMADTAAYHQALGCHHSQFAPAWAAQIEKALDDGWNSQVSFRGWNGIQTAQNDLFK